MPTTSMSIHLTRPYGGDPIVISGDIAVLNHGDRRPADPRETDLYVRANLMLGNMILTIFVDRGEEALALAKVLSAASEALLSFEANLPAQRAS